MTTGTVTSVNPVSDFKAAKLPSGNGGGADFSQVFKASTDKAQEQAVKPQTRDEQPQDKPKVDDKEPKQQDTVAETEKTSEVQKTQDGEPTKEDISDDAMEAAQEAVMAAAQILGVSPQEIMDALQELDMDVTDLLDSANVPQIAVAVTGATDTMAIMTDESLFAKVKELTGQINEIVEDLSVETGIDADEIKDAIKAGDFTASTQNTEIQKPQDANRGEAAGENNGSENNGSENSQMNFNQSLVENIKNAAASKTEGVEQTAFDPDMERIYSQVQESIKLHMDNEVTEMEMNLHPASLGNVKVQVAARDGVITANFVTQNEQVRAALESQMAQLKEDMNEQGIKVENIEVTLASHAFEENLSKDNESSSFENETKKKRRNINLNEIDEEVDIDIEDDVRIAREMMLHNGTTVDYMA